MKENKLSVLINILVVLFFVIGLSMTMIIYPIQTGVYQSLSKEYSLSVLNVIEFFSYVILSIPCFIILILSIKISLEIYKESIYSKKIIPNLRLSGFLLISSSFLFIAGNIVFTIVSKRFSYEAIYVLVGVVGLAIGLIYLLAAAYWNKAIELKKETEEFV